MGWDMKESVIHVIMIGNDFLDNEDYTPDWFSIINE